MGQRKRIATLERPEDEHALLCIRSEPHGMSDVGLEHDAYHAEETTPEQLITEEKLNGLETTHPSPLLLLALVHDAHAEVIARRALLCLIYAEIGTDNPPSWLVASGTDGRWRLKDGHQLHLYITQIPCGVMPVPLSPLEVRRELLDTMVNGCNGNSIEHLDEVKDGSGMTIVTRTMLLWMEEVAADLLLLLD